MTIRIMGALLVILGCGGVGFMVAASYRTEERVLRQLLNALDYMQCELQYRLTPLPELCRKVGTAAAGQIREVFLSLAAELEDQISPNVERCMSHALLRCRELPKYTRQVLELIGVSMGRFDLDGQLKGLEAGRRECRRGLEELASNKAVRLRSYQTLALCAGAAIAILFI